MFKRKHSHDYTAEMHRQTQEVDDLQEQRRVAEKRGDAVEVEFYNRLVIGALDMLEWLQNEVQQSRLGK